MRKLMKWFQAWRTRHVLRYIGKVDRKCDLEQDDPKKKRTVTVSILFHMSPSGKRKVTWPHINGYQALDKFYSGYQIGQDIDAWEKGGDLPKEFIPTADDGFKQLLRAIVDQEMGLEN